MKLDQETQDLYFSKINSHSYRLSRLDDRDSELTVEERRVEINKIIKELNRDVKDLLSEENYESHVVIFDDILKMIYEKYSWEWDRK